MFVFNKIYRYSYLKNIFKYKIKICWSSLYNLFYINTWLKMNINDFSKNDIRIYFLKNLFKRTYLDDIFRRYFLEILISSNKFSKKFF